MKKKHKIKVEFECGEKTCASRRGEFCGFLRKQMKSWGVEKGEVCNLYDVTLFEDKPGGWLMRCPKCLEDHG